MTVKVQTTFTNRFNPSHQVVIVTRVTDRMEDRQYFKKSYGSMKNRQKFEQDHVRVGDWKGKPVLLWDEKTEII